MWIDRQEMTGLIVQLVVAGEEDERGCIRSFPYDFFHDRLKLSDAAPFRWSDDRCQPFIGAFHNVSFLSPVAVASRIPNVLAWIINEFCHFGSEPGPYPIRNSFFRLPRLSRHCFNPQPLWS